MTPPSVKKRKLQHQLSAGAARKPQGADAAKPAGEDPRFQINSDFSDSENERDNAGDPAAVKKGKRTPNALKTSGEQLFASQTRAGSGSQEPDSGPATDVEADSDGDDDGSRARRASGREAGASGSADDDSGDGAADGDGQTQDGMEQQEQEDGQRKAKKVLTKRKLERVKEASDRRGIVYISRIPPHMKPHKLRQLLEPHGDIGRVYCAPEDPALRRMRKKKGGNSGKNFTEGWVEFEDKRRAKRAALALNGQPMGGSKRSAYYYDLWNIKYLPKFKWDALTEEINYQRAVREQRLVAEISAAKRERDFYLSRVDKAKAIDAIKERRAKKQQDQPEAAGAGGAAAVDAAAGSGDGAGAGAGAARQGAPERHFGQRRAKADPVLDDHAPVLADDVLGLLGGKKQQQQQEKKKQKTR